MKQDLDSVTVKLSFGYPVLFSLPFDSGCEYLVRWYYVEWSSFDLPVYSFSFLYIKDIFFPYSFTFGIRLDNLSVNLTILSYLLTFCYFLYMPFDTISGVFI